MKRKSRVKRNGEGTQLVVVNHSQQLAHLLVEATRDMKKRNLTLKILGHQRIKLHKQKMIIIPFQMNKM